MARISSARGLDKMYHQYTDTEGHAEFLRDPAAEPLHVKFFVRGKSFGPYTPDNGAKYTVKVSREWHAPPVKCCPMSVQLIHLSGTLSRDGPRSGVHAVSLALQPEHGGRSLDRFERNRSDLDSAGSTAVGFQHHGGPAESIVTVAEHPRPVSVSLESTGPRLIDEPQAFGEGTIRLRNLATLEEHAAKNLRKDGHAGTPRNDG